MDSCKASQGVWDAWALGKDVYSYSNVDSFDSTKDVYSNAASFDDTKACFLPSDLMMSLGTEDGKEAYEGALMCSMLRDGLSNIAEQEQAAPDDVLSVLALKSTTKVEVEKGPDVAPGLNGHRAADGRTALRASARPWTPNERQNKSWNESWNGSWNQSRNESRSEEHRIGTAPRYQAALLVTTLIKALHARLRMSCQLQAIPERRGCSVITRLSEKDMDKSMEFLGDLKIIVQQTLLEALSMSNSILWSNPIVITKDMNRGFKVTLRDCRDSMFWGRSYRPGRNWDHHMRRYSLYFAVKMANDSYVPETGTHQLKFIVPGSDLSGRT